MTSKEIEEKILALKRPGIKAKYLIEAELDDLVALIQQARVDQTRVIRDRFVRSGWEYKWLTEVISELKGESK